MTRYFLFEYDDYEPLGGFDDLTGIFESESDAFAEIKSRSSWRDNTDVYSLEDDNDKPKFLYYKFNVLGESNMLQSVIGNKDKKIIKLVGVSIGKARWPESYKNTRMGDFKMEVE